MKDIKTGRTERFCLSCKYFHVPSVFDGFHRTCKGKLSDRARAAAAEVAARIERQNAAAAAGDGERHVAWLPEWGDHTQVVDGQTARTQVKAYLGAGVADFVQKVLGRPGGSDADIDEAVQKLGERLLAGNEPPRNLSGAVGLGPVAPSTCALCGEQTTAGAFVGKSVCLPCAAAGHEGLTLLDVSHILGAGLLYGKGGS